MPYGHFLWTLFGKAFMMTVQWLTLRRLIFTIYFCKFNFGVDYISQILRFLANPRKVLSTSLVFLPYLQKLNRAKFLSKSLSGVVSLLNNS